MTVEVGIWRLGTARKQLLRGDSCTPTNTLTLTSSRESLSKHLGKLNRNLYFSYVEAMEDLRLLRFHVGKLSFWELVVDEGYTVAAGYRVIFTHAEPTHAIWIHSVMTLDEPLTDFLIEILHARLNVVLERMHISHDNPFGLPN